MIKGNVFYGEVSVLSDMFSLGLMFHEMLFKKELFTDKMMRLRIENETINFGSEKFQLIPAGCLNLLKRMLEFNPTNRINPFHALAHSFFAKAESFNIRSSLLGRLDMIEEI